MRWWLSILGLLSLGVAASAYGPQYGPTYGSQERLILQDGLALDPQRPNVNCVTPLTCTDDPLNNATSITAPAGGGGDVSAASPTVTSGNAAVYPSAAGTTIGEPPTAPVVGDSLLWVAPGRADWFNVEATKAWAIRGATIDRDYTDGDTVLWDDPAFSHGNGVSYLNGTFTFLEPGTWRLRAVIGAVVTADCVQFEARFNDQSSGEVDIGVKAFLGIERAQGNAQTVGMQPLVEAIFQTDGSNETLRIDAEACPGFAVGSVSTAADSMYIELFEIFDGIVGVVE